MFVNHYGIYNKRKDNTHSKPCISIAQVFFFPCHLSSFFNPFYNKSPMFAFNGYGKKRASLSCGQEAEPGSQGVSARPRRTDGWPGWPQARSVRLAAPGSAHLTSPLRTSLVGCAASLVPGRAGGGEHLGPWERPEKSQVPGPGSNRAEIIAITCFWGFSFLSPPGHFLGGLVAFPASIKA